MRHRLRDAVLVLAAGFATMAAGAANAASVREQQSYLIWHKHDVCAHEALVKFPDYTVDSNAKRAQEIRDCERRNSVLQRPATNVAPIKRIPDSAAE